jgi:hypothetical protein
LEVLENMNIKSECKDCTKRHVGCHTDCQAYMEFKLKVAQVNEAERQYKEMNHFHHNVGMPGFGNGIRRARDRRKKS